MMQQRGPGGSGSHPMDHDPRPQANQRSLVRHTLHLHKVGARVTKAGFRKVVLEGTIVREEDQSLTVRIEPPGGIYIVRERTKIGERGAIRITRKLADNPIGFEKQEIVETVSHAGEGRNPPGK